jgi:anti-sigma factor ChrR (cupin superfamily)
VNRDLLNHLLGSGDRDPGCEACFELLDQYAEAALRGEDAGKRFPQIAAHLAGCPACREDTEGLIAALRRQGAQDEPR